MKLSKKNLVVSEELTTEYSFRRTDIEGVWLCTRSASKRYSFIGLTLDDAYAARSSREAMYTRRYKRFVDLDGAGTMSNVSVMLLSTVISVRNDVGKFYRLDIDVNELDEVVFVGGESYVGRPPTPRDVFGEIESERTYDENLGSNEISIVIESARMHGTDAIIGVYYISDFDVDGTGQIQYLGADESKGWIYFSSAQLQRGHGVSVFITIRNATGNVPRALRAAFGTYTSQPVEIKYT